MREEIYKVIDDILRKLEMREENKELREENQKAEH